MPHLRYNPAQHHQDCVPFRHGHVDAHEVRAFLDHLRRPRLESSFGGICRLRDRPRLNTSGLRDTDTNRRSGKSHAAFGLRHVDNSLRTIFLPVTFFTPQSALKYSFRDSCFCLLGYSCHFFHPYFLCSCPCRSCLCCLFLYLHERCHDRSAQPTLLNGHQGRNRNHGPEATSSPHLIRRVASLLLPHVGSVQVLICTTSFIYGRVKSVGVQQITADPVRLSYQVRFLFTVIRLFGWILFPRGGRVVPIVVLVAIFCREVLFFPEHLRVELPLMLALDRG